MLIVIIGGLLTFGCDHRVAVERDYSETISFQGKPVLEVICEYVGKEPGDPTSYQQDHDYRRTDTDFYKLTFRNLTNNDITLEGVSYRMKIGRFRGNQSASADSIRRSWGTNVIPAQGSLHRSNNMVWAKSRKNTLFKTYHFGITFEQSRGRFKAEVPFVYRR